MLSLGRSLAGENRMTPTDFARLRRVTGCVPRGNSTRSLAAIDAWRDIDRTAAAAYNSRLRNELTRVCGPHNGRTVTVVYFVVSAAREIFDVERKKTRLASDRVDSFQLHLRRCPTSENVLLQLTKGSGLFSRINSLCPVVNFTPVSLPLTRFSNFITIFSADSPLSPPKTLLFSPSF